MPKGNLNSQEKAAQQKLLKEWERWKAEEKGRTQQSMADLLDMNQSSLGQYINGRNPLNVEFILKICSVIRCNPAEIYPEIFEDIDLSVIKQYAGGQISEAVSILEKMTETELDTLMAFLRETSK